MNYYVLPGAGIYGGIKVGFQFCDLLSELGVRIVAVTPDGQAPQWFASSAPVISVAGMKARLDAGDTIFFSLPDDHAWLMELPGTKVLHCQGADEGIEKIIADPDLVLLACWEQAERFIGQKTARPVINVGMSIPDCFFYDIEPKDDRLVAYMPRRGRKIAEACMSRMRRHRFFPIDGMIEPDCAWNMKRSGYFLATSVNEFFGLPALEAMAAGCVVASVPVLGGMDYLESGANCVLAEPEALPDCLAELATHEAAGRRSALRHAAIATAYRYRRSAHRRHLAACLETRLGEVVSWA